MEKEILYTTEKFTAETVLLYNKLLRHKGKKIKNMKSRQAELNLKSTRRARRIMKKSKLRFESWFLKSAALTNKFIENNEKSFLSTRKLPKKINVCKDLKCTQNKRVTVDVAGTIYDFCCQDGFEKTLKEFNAFLNKNKE